MIRTRIAELEHDLRVVRRANDTLRAANRRLVGQRDEARRERDWSRSLFGPQVPPADYTAAAPAPAAIPEEVLVPMSPRGPSSTTIPRSTIPRSTNPNNAVYWGRG